MFFSQDESAHIWFEQKQKKTGSRDSLSFLDTAVADTLGSQTELQSVLPPLTQSGSVPGNDYCDGGYTTTTLIPSRLYSAVDILSPQ